LANVGEATPFSTAHADAAKLLLDVVGATTDRPAFQRLLADIAAKKIDCVAVCRIDRLSRSFADYVGILKLFEQHGVTFVSVTEQFNTTTPTGRLVLNQLILFSQFEREIISERIRDKLQASRRRGLFTGGRPILGYCIVDKKLLIDEDEAAQVRWIFARYVEMPSLSAVASALAERGWRNKSYTGKRGQQVVGQRFTKKTLHQLLKNELYRGLQRTKDGAVPGAHASIIDDELWFAVQERMNANRQNTGASVRNQTGALLRGLIHCGRCGSPFVHSFTTKRGRRYRSYVCERAHNEGVAKCLGARVQAARFEGFVVDQIRAIGTDEVLLSKTAAAVARVAADRRAELFVEQRQLGK
jgi:site-specific DNA recombinase